MVKLIVFIIGLLINSTYSLSLQCKNNTYYNSQYVKCCKLCEPGTFYSKKCDEKNDTICEKCPDGSYTSVYNHSPACVSCRGYCDYNQVETTSCTPTSNRICKCKLSSYCLVKGYNENCRVCVRKKMN
ncbi:truncated TNF-receptor-like protein [Yokapox virus]|uniref:Truncated TNF-receptor-like protein n=1 Tax=Yokapox virus TaxID=1076255 RepID=G3EI70_9POXV|nr:truncated TNF-receptor-like protein [Yokapox virus]AEN03767.1 truncated TNF-receptor-like protein [Yokapox virus]